MFDQTNWRSNTMLTALFFPGIVFAVFFGLNLFVWGQKSSGAVPFGTLFAILVLWFGISVPLVYFGAFFGNKRDKYDLPVKVSPPHTPNVFLFLFSNG